mgnify:CR=1 FL=1
MSDLRTPVKKTLSLKRLLLGPRLHTAEMPHQTIGKAVGLAIFASDALSSTAYATEEILLILILAGTAALTLSLPIAIAIIILLAIVTISYNQTIHAYPGGGGAYIVARDNLGEVPAQIAGAALLVDYILTVAVSISAGVAQIASSFPALHPWRVSIALCIIGLMTLVNLRGIKESGRIFALPTYFFLAMTLFTIIIGFYHYFTGTLGMVTGIEPLHGGAIQALTLFLILRAFSSGCAALTGVEAISNGVTVFKEPRSRNAGITMIWMSTLLSAIFFGITFLAMHTGTIPSHTETVFSQIGRVIYSAGSPLYLALIGSTTLILVMAANTSYAGFPQLGAMQASDGFLPKQLTYRGGRLVFTYGILTLAVMASLLIIVFRANTNALIPLYAIGVFLSFTISQIGMAVRWFRCGRLEPGEELRQMSSTLQYNPKWKTKLIINSLGAFSTFIVMIVFAVTKFVHGAWIVIFLIPLLVYIFSRIHNHYKELEAALSLKAFKMPPYVKRHRVIVPISSVHKGTMKALHYARTLSNDITAVHVLIDPDGAGRIKATWDYWGDGVRLEVIESPYRLLLEPLIDYIKRIASQRQPNEVITIVVPEFVPVKRWHSLLHMQTAFFLQIGLLGLRDIVITEVPYHVNKVVAGG